MSGTRCASGSASVVGSLIGARWLLWSIALGVMVPTVSEIARAELFRCSGPDGNVVFTDDASVCPGSTPFETTKKVQRVQSSAPAAQHAPERLEAARHRRMVERSEDGEAARWKRIKREKEYEFKVVEHNRDRLYGLVSWCNSGGRVVTYDDAGIKQGMDCAELREELSVLEERKTALSDYLSRGLAEECRRAGCLPGWLR
jgi:hypothetical protein